MSFSLSPVAELAVKYANTTNRNIFLTGKAGSGKTTLLKYIIENTFKNVVVAAPTGIAAINAGGVTLHSLLQLPFGTFIPENIPFSTPFSSKINTPHSVISELQMSATKRSVLKEAELLIIDEVSMLRADLLDCINTVLQYVRKRKGQPFGGVQVLFIGDLNQLPPVIKNSEWPLLNQYYRSPYFFDAHVLRQSPPIFIELDTIYRQSEQQFIDILNRLRDNKLEEADMMLLNSHFKKDYSKLSDEGYIHITTHNRKSDIINEKALKNLKSPAFSYYADINGDFPEHLFPVPEELIFKEGAQVMFIKNDPGGEGKFFNGRIGQIVKLEEGKIDVLLNDSQDIVHVQPYTWENKKYSIDPTTNEVEENIIGTYEHFPLKLAWAITVHKSQGLTFDKAILDLSDSFAPGQMYVALSRLTSLKGLVLSTRIPETGIEIDQALSDFALSKTSYDLLKDQLLKDRKEFLVEFISQSFNFEYIKNGIAIHLKSIDKLKMVIQDHISFTVELFQSVSELQKVTTKFTRQLQSIIQSENYLPGIHERVTKAEEYFLPLLNNLVNGIRNIRQQSSGKLQLKTYSKELKELESMFLKQIQKIKKARLLVSFVIENKIPRKSDISVKIDPVENNRKKKGSTQKITFDLYKQGLTIEEIAAERGLSYNTIEGHLAKYITSGDLKLSLFINDDKAQKILLVARELNTKQLRDIKDKLGDEFTYGDIKMVMASIEKV